MCGIDIANVDLPSILTTLLSNKIISIKSVVHVYIFYSQYCQKL